MALDEGRFGLITWLRRRLCPWCPLGERPPWIVQDEYEWLWLYAAVEPTTGTAVFLLLPTVEGVCLEIFLQHLHNELGEGAIGVVLDSAGSHRSGEVSWPQDMHPLYLPAYSPERGSRRADLPASAQAALQCHFHDARRVAKRAHRRAPAVLGASDGAPPAHRLSLVGRGRQHKHIIQFLKEYNPLLSSWESSMKQVHDADEL